MSVMAVELGASRLLAPYFSSSQIVWTIIIGTIMIAMALGNLYGGRLADKDPDPGRLYKRLMIAGLWIGAIPLIGKYIIMLISGIIVVAVSTGFLIWAAFISCMILFVFPLFLLGTVTPSLVKYSVQNLDESGKTVGTLGAFNTIGSIIGTFLPTFVTIPTVGTSISFLIFSGVLILLGLIYFINSKTKLTFCLISIGLFLGFCIWGHDSSFAFWESSLTYEGESIYNYLHVKEDRRRILLSTNVLFGVQSITMKDDSLTGMYYDIAMAAPVMAGKDFGKEEVLILGMGTGTYARQCKRYFDGMSLEGVEIDGKITNLSYEYFDAAKDVPVSTYDGRAYLDEINKKFDVIMVDAYQDITIPFQMSSIEFFSSVKNHLKNGGVMVVNMNMHSNKAGAINEALSDTIAAVFPYVYTMDVEGNSNLELFACVDNDPKKTLYENKASLAEANPELYELMRLVENNLQPYMRDSKDYGENVLTDDKAPVELLGMRMIDSLIQEEAAYYKKYIKENGFTGLLDAL